MRLYIQLRSRPTTGLPRSHSTISTPTPSVPSISSKPPAVPAPKPLSYTCPRIRCTAICRIQIALREFETRWDYADPAYAHGIPETFSIDQSKHSLFGASKVASDVMVQEYGRYFGMPTCCLRGGCLTGPNHSGVELHGFLSYLVRCNIEDREYKVFGYKGKQVRDNIHSEDVANFIVAFCDSPRSGRGL